LHERDVGFGDGVLDLREVARLVDVGLDPREHLAPLHAVALAHEQLDHLAREHRLHVHLHLRLDGADLGDADLHVGHLGLGGFDLALLVLGLRLGTGHADPDPRDRQDHEPDPDPPAHTFPVRLRHEPALVRAAGGFKSGVPTVRPLIRGPARRGSENGIQIIEAESNEPAAGAKRYGRAGGTMLDDARFALRTLLKRTGVSLLLVSTLALGLAANAIIFNVLDAVVL